MPQKKVKLMYQVAEYVILQSSKIMQGCKITSNPFAGIKHKHPLKQIHGATRHSGEPCTELLLGILRKRPHISAGIVASKKPKARVIREQRLPCNDLPKDAAYRPSINSCSVL